MGLCQFCGENAGWLSARHSYCAEDRQHGGADAAALAEEAATTWQELVGPFADGQDLVPELKELDQDSRRRLSLEVPLQVIWVFIVAGRRISPNEAVIIRALRRRLDPSFNDFERTSSLDQLRQFYEKYMLSSAETLLPIFRSLGLYVAPLEAYDHIHGTTTAERARTILLRLANTIAKADGRVTQQDEKRLTDLKSLLWTSSGDVKNARG